jgi:dipeptidyl aminopeptidase/acylaminoacyl peptidase
MSKAKTTVSPYGSWKSPITSDLIAAEAIGLTEVNLDGDGVYWLETRPRENGRCVVVRSRLDGSAASDLLPQPFSARTRAHEYGGGAWCVSGGTLCFSNDARRPEGPDRRLYRLDGDASEPAAVTPSGGWRYADGLVDVRRKRWIGVREDHTDRGRAYPDNAIVAVDVDAPGTDPGAILACGHDFYSSPRLSPDGKRLAWLAWDHPNMPWTACMLCVIELGDDGGPIGSPVVIAGADGDESLYQPEWSPDGSALFFVSDRSGWWNLCAHDLASRTSRQVLPMAAEFGEAQWAFGMSSYGFTSRNRIIATYASDGLGRLGLIDLASGTLEPLDLPFTVFRSVRSDGGDRAVFCAGAPDRATGIVLLDLASGARRLLKQSTQVADAPEIHRYFTRVQPIAFPTEEGKTAYGLFYPPRNPDFVSPQTEKPPLLVRCHGGPTSSASSALSLVIQFWTSRGIAVLDLNYGGSTGYGREYRYRLHRSWGIVDVDDAVNAAKFLVAQGWVDERRLVIAGGSAGGYTALAALTFREYFSGGTSYYGVSDLAKLAETTHKFEAHYLDWLIGPYPQAQDLYEARSPLHHADRLSRPVLFLQGEEDAVVPPAQAETMVEALRRRHTPVGCLLFSGEQHGFRRAATIQRALDAEAYFYAFNVFDAKLMF